MLLITAAVWGFAFVAQRVGMTHLGPFSYQGVRFLLGAAVLLPIALAAAARARSRVGAARSEAARADAARDGAALPAAAASDAGRAAAASAGAPRLWRDGPRLWRDGLLAGLLLFGGSSFQQVGLQYTTAGNAGFITGFYVVLVPLLGGFLGYRSERRGWLGALIAVAGLYLLSITSGFRLQRGDAFIIACAVFFALHVLVLARIAPRHRAVDLAVVQYLVCGVVSMGVALGFEEISAAAVLRSWAPIAYGGSMSVGVAYSLQIVGQRRAHPTHAAIVLSLEGMFAALGGWLLLSEVLTPREGAGAALLVVAMLVSQGVVRFGRRNGPAAHGPADGVSERSARFRRGHRRPSRPPRSPSGGPLQ